MKKLCVFTLYPERGASSKYRFFLYKEDLESKFEIKWFSFWNDTYVKTYMHHKKKYLLQISLLYMFSFLKRLCQLVHVASKADVCFFQKACIPKFRYNHIARLKKKGVRVIFDVDDAVYMGKRDYSDDIAQLSDVVICGNDNLVQHYRNFNANVIMLPTVEKTSLFQVHWKNTFENKTIGWIGSLTTIDNLDLVVNPINNIVDKYPNVNFLIISNSAQGYEKKIKNCRFVSWNKDSYISDLSSITIGIMPLKDNEFNRGKCGFKLVQYLNLKKPVIASNIGVNKEIVGKCGLIADSEKEWEIALQALLFDKNKYFSCQNNIDEEFLPKYSYNSVLNRLIEIMD